MDTLLISLVLIATIAIAPFLLSAAVVFLTKRQDTEDLIAETTDIGEKDHRPVSLREMKKARRKEFANLSFLKKPPAYVLRGIGSLGALVFGISLFNLLWIGMAIGLVITIISELLYQWLVGGLIDGD